MDIKYFKKIKLPDCPGVYFFLKGKEILYIGKATSLRDRVKSYFGKDLIETRGPIILDLVCKADKIKWQETDSVLEALILEAALIKKHQPKYNTKEKSDTSWNYVCITKEQLPKVVIKRGKVVLQEENSYLNIFGPFPNGSQLREAMKLVRKIFPFLDDKSKNYLEFYRQINLVPDLEDRKLYLENIRNIRLFFSGKKKQIFRNLKKEMNVFAKAKRFEEAGEIKRQLFALRHINDVALIKGQVDLKNDSFRIEAYDIAHMGGKSMVGVMTVVENDELARNEYRKFKIRTQKDANDTGALAEVLDRRLAHPEWRYPNLVVVDGSRAQINIAEKVLAKIGMMTPVVSVVKDERHRPKGILGNRKYVSKYERNILSANSEAHRFAIAYHKKVRGKNFLI